MSTTIAQPTPDKIQILAHEQYDSPDALSPSSVAPDPLEQFRAWFKAVSGRGNVREPEAMTICTATATGVPSARVVLLKQADARGFVFYTNYTSRKSRELTENPHAALAFYWREESRQVRVVGRAERVTREESEEYFHSRPRGSQVGAWASKQSTVVQDGEIQARAEKLKERFGEAEVPLPEFWGGWRIVPDEVEFWLGKPSRLHDRVVYTRVGGSSDDAPLWKVDRLAP
ncbi:pyridoxamine 5'-phosphate oxidase [Trametes versicolor FP-101664 SS1]|uniref:pyridoxamine 5'-phosphate oxidase n=1 Tax=Trametes versicolor (strain FP-101664) TaxID=717944 RepID=UPI000462474B|nr:pyridoxamine 5'-phosphate oxidase [Trametes versicolor FP-101664 SS1]EIW59511.1 pyridoxamine 5'-phosphate oxidase [Trametes versicolor FP-101664 SS1]